MVVINLSIWQANLVTEFMTQPDLQNIVKPLPPPTLSLTKQTEATWPRPVATSRGRGAEFGQTGGPLPWGDDGEEKNGILTSSFEILEQHLCDLQLPLPCWPPHTIIFWAY